MPTTRAAERHVSFLVQAATRLLSTSLDPDQTFRQLTELVVPAVADSCVVHVIDEATGMLRVAARAWRHPSQQATALALGDRFPTTLHDDNLLARVVRTRKAELFAKMPVRELERCASSPEHLAFLRALGVRSAMTAPLIARQRVLGVVTLALTDATRSYEAADLDMIEQLAVSAGLAVENARLYQYEQNARATMALLYGFVDAVNRAKNLSEVYDESLEVVHRALSVTRSSILLFDDDGVPRFKSSRGLSDVYRAAVEGHSPWSRDAKVPSPIFFTDSEQDEAAAAYRETFRKEGIRALGFFPLVHHGTLLGKFMVYSAVPRIFTDDEVRLAQTIATQISQAVVRKLSQAEAEAARASAEYASRMKDEFLAVVSHELRTPLASIMGWASILQTDRGNEPAMLAKGLEAIDRNARAQATIIEDILDVSRIIRGKLRLDPHPITFVPLIVQTIDALGMSATAKEILVELKAGDDPFCIVGDPERLRQIVWNLLSNAIKFTPSKGKVTVRLRRELGAIVLEVSDTGIGIAHELLPYVFDRFRQADSTTTRRHGGLGLGLSIVRHLVELHGGQVDVQSGGAGKGSTFLALLPVRAVAPEAMSSRAQGEEAGSATSGATMTLPAGSPDLEGVRVLVVDDQPDAREMLKEALASYGAVIEVAGSAVEAEEIIQTFRPEVLVTDIGMPDNDGYALLRRVRALPGDLAHLPAVAVTAYARAEDACQARAAGFHSHVSKPTRPETLAQAVARALSAAP